MLIKKIITTTLFIFTSFSHTESTDSIFSFVKDAHNNSAKNQSITSISNQTLPNPPQEQQLEKYELTESLLEQEPIIIEEKQTNSTPTEKQKEQHAQAQKEEIEKQKFKLNFEDATLENIAHYIEDIFSVQFLPDDAVKPMMANGGPLQGQKISFKTNKALSKKETWNLFIRFLDLAQLTIVPGPTKNMYRITSSVNASRDPVEFFFNTPIEKLPDDPRRVRFVYFVKNAPLQTIVNIVGSLKNTLTTFAVFPEINAIILTDKATNIRSFMHIIEEIDRSLPEAMTCIQLSHVEPLYAMKMYNDLAGIDTNQQNRYLVTQKKQVQSTLFPVSVRIIPEPRLNSLFLLGAKKDIDRIEHVIQTTIDVAPNLPYSPLRSITLQYMKSDNVTSMLNQMVAFGKNNPDTLNTATYGGSLDGQRYFKNVTIISEPSFNRLIIKASDEDFKKISDFIEQIDIPQPQIGIEILIVDVSAETIKQWGSQIRNKGPNSLFNIQTSGYPTSTTGTFSSIITNTSTTPGSDSLIGNLAALTASATNPIGSTVLTIGNAVNGVWGIFKILETYSSPKVIANPFFVTTNKTKGSFKFGQQRRVQTATIAGGSPSTSAINADLTIAVTPHVNSNNIIGLDISIQMNDFSDSSSAGSGNTNNKSIITNALLKDQEVLILGGMIQDVFENTIIKVPILGDIPIVGNIFKTITKTHKRSNILFFICPKILTSKSTIGSKKLYTQQKAEEIRTTLRMTKNRAQTMNPLENTFFNDDYEDYQGAIDTFLQDETSKDIARKEREKRPVFEVQKAIHTHASKRLSQRKQTKKEIETEPSKKHFSKRLSKKRASS